MNTPEVDIKDMLVADGVCTFQTDLFIGRLSDTPDDCAALTTYADTPVSGICEDRLADIRVQVLTRGTANQAGYTGAYAQARTIVGALHMTLNRIQGGSMYEITLFNGPSFVQFDERGRPLWSTNFRCWRKSTS